MSVAETQPQLPRLPQIRFPPDLSLAPLHSLLFYKSPQFYIPATQAQFLMLRQPRDNAPVSAAKSTGSMDEGKPTQIPNFLVYDSRYFWVSIKYLPLKPYRPHKLKIPKCKWLSSMLEGEGSSVFVYMEVFMFHNGQTTLLKHIVMKPRVWEGLQNEAKQNIKQDFSVVVWHDPDLERAGSGFCVDLSITKSVSELVVGMRNCGKVVKNVRPVLLFSYKKTILFGVQLKHRVFRRIVNNNDNTNPPPQPQPDLQLQIHPKPQQLQFRPNHETPAQISEGMCCDFPSVDSNKAQQRSEKHKDDSGTNRACTSDPAALLATLKNGVPNTDPKKKLD